MRDVKLVRLSDDGTHVVLTHEGTGEEFALRIDDRLRGFVTSDRARVAQLPVERPSRLSPKEIQARLRAGESSEDIAAAADVSLERVMRYAGPVLAEREYLTEQAQTALLRRPPGNTQNGGQSRALGSTVTDRLEALGTNISQIRWDAWRMADGRWAVAVFYHLPGTTEEAQATFGFDPVGRTVVAIDDAGEWILGERTTQQQQTTTVEGPAPRTPRDARPRLTAVPAPDGDGLAGEGEPGQHDTVVRTLRPAPAPDPAAVPSNAPASESEPGRQPESTGSDGASVDDRIAYEPTVDLSRSMHDQPQPPQGPPEQQTTGPARSTERVPHSSQPADRRSASHPPEYPAPPRLSPADLPDLGESSNPVPPPPEPATQRDGAHQLGTQKQDTVSERARPSEPQPEPAAEEPTVGPVTSPEPAATVPTGAASGDPEASDDQPLSVTEQPVTPATVASSPAPTSAPVPEPATSGQPEPHAQPEPAAAVDAPAHTRVAEHEPPTATDAAQSNGAPRSAEAQHDGTSAHAGDEQPKDQTADAPAQTSATDQNTETSNGSKEDAGDNDKATAGKKSLGQDRRTSGNRRRRAAGSRRKGAVPSWDDILFGGGGKD